MFGETPCAGSGACCSAVCGSCAASVFSTPLQLASREQNFIGCRHRIIQIAIAESDVIQSVGVDFATFNGLVGNGFCSIIAVGVEYFYCQVFGCHRWQESVNVGFGGYVDVVVGTIGEVHCQGLGSRGGG